MIVQENPLGLHILLTLQTDDPKKLVEVGQFIEFTEKILQRFQLEKVGFTKYIFDNQSYTVAFCLMESHICIHTWPENKNLALDIYLCNYSQDNTERVKKISEEIVQYFDAEIIKKSEIFR